MEFHCRSIRWKNSLCQQYTPPGLTPTPSCTLSSPQTRGETSSFRNFTVWAERNNSIEPEHRRCRKHEFLLFLSFTHYFFWFCFSLSFNLSFVFFLQPNTHGGNHKHEARGNQHNTASNHQSKENKKPKIKRVHPMCKSETLFIFFCFISFSYMVASHHCTQYTHSHRITQSLWC